MSTNPATLLLLVAVSGAALGQGYSNFECGTGALPRSVAVGDVNGDGAPDLVSANGGTTVCSLLFGEGDGLFPPQMLVPVGLVPLAATLADMNHDGKLDLVVCLTSALAGSPVEVGIRRGNGDGSFSPIVVYAVAGSTTGFVGFVVHDMNGDGTPDVIVATAGDAMSASEICVLLGDGSGGLGASTAFSPSLGAPGLASMAGVCVADMNGDGKPDVVTNDHVNLLTMFGDGLGALAAPVTFVESYPSTCLAVGDMNKDGKIDVVAGFALSTPGVFSYLGHGDGQFTSPPAWAPDAAITTSLAIADMNGDGFPDTLAASAAGNVVLLHPGNPNGFPGIATTVGTASTPSALAVSDLDADGMPDFAVSNSGNNTIGVHRSLAAQPAGALLIGTGTSGSSGMLGMSASGPPHTSLSSFRLTCTNAPKNALGLCIVGNVPDFGSSDELGIGLALNVNLLLSTFTLGVNAHSDAGGSGVAPLPIPNNPALTGIKLYTQTIWVEDAKNGQSCSHAAAGLVSSEGLRITL